MAAQPRPMFMDTFRIEPDKDLVHVGLMDCGPDGFRPEVDGPTLDITIPLTQLRPLMGDLARAFDSPALADAIRSRAETLQV
jgi:hypothetical protein